MANMTGARGTKTRLVIGAVKCDVILHGTVADAPKLKDYATAGPHGRPLRRVQRAVESAPEDTVADGGIVPVQKARPLEVGPPSIDVSAEVLRRQEGLLGNLASEAEKAGGSLKLSRSPAEAAELGPVPTVDQGPGELRSVLVEEPGEGESIDSMPALEPEHLLRGIRQADGSFIDLTKQLADIEARTSLDTMEVVATIDIGQVPRNRVQGSYYVSFDKIKDGEGEPGTIRVLYEAMRSVRRAPVVKYTARSRQALGVLTANGRTGTLELLKLAWAEDVRVPGEKQLAHMKASVYDVEVEAMAELLRALGESKAEGLDVLRDDARELRDELEAAATSGELEDFTVFEPQPEPVGTDLMAALEASLAAVARS